MSSSETDANTPARTWDTEPKDHRWPPLSFPADCEVVNAYRLRLEQSIPWLGQRTLIDAINCWIENGVISTFDVWVEACDWSGLDPKTATSINAPIGEYAHAVRAQHYAWTQLEILAEGRMAEEPASPFDLNFDNATRKWPTDEQGNVAKGWLWYMIATLDEQSGALRISTIFGELPQNIKDALGHELAPDILETPYLFGNLLYRATNHFWPGFGGPSTVLVALAEKWNKAAQAELPAHDRAFWQCAIQGFLYAAAHPEHDQTALAHQLDQHHPDNVMMVVSSLKLWAATPRTMEWTNCPGPGKQLNSSIAYTEPRELLDTLFG